MYISPNDTECRVKVTDSSAKMIGTTAELKPKTWVKLWDLLYGAMLPSGNDAALLLAEVLGYLEKVYGNSNNNVNNYVLA